MESKRDAFFSVWFSCDPTPHDYGHAFFRVPPPAWSVETRRAPSRRCRDARVYGHTTTAMNDKMVTPPRARRIMCSGVYRYKEQPMPLTRTRKAGGGSVAIFWHVWVNNNIMNGRASCPSPSLFHAVHKMLLWLLQETCGQFPAVAFKVSPQVYELL